MTTPARATPLRTNQSQKAWVYSNDGPISRRKRGYILTTDQSVAESVVAASATEAPSPEGGTTGGSGGLGGRTMQIMPPVLDEALVDERLGREHRLLEHLELALVRRGHRAVLAVALELHAACQSHSRTQRGCLSFIHLSAASRGCDVLAHGHRAMVVIWRARATAFNVGGRVATEIVKGASWNSTRGRWGREGKGRTEDGSVTGGPVELVEIDVVGLEALKGSLAGGEDDLFVVAVGLASAVVQGAADAHRVHLGGDVDLGALELTLGDALLHPVAHPHLGGLAVIESHGVQLRSVEEVHSRIPALGGSTSASLFYADDTFFAWPDIRVLKRLTLMRRTINRRQYALSYQRASICSHA
eukprot:112327-Prorocentrum_minimum.AAC.1